MSGIRRPGLEVAWGIQMGQELAEEDRNWSQVLASYYVVDENDREM